MQNVNVSFRFANTKCVVVFKTLIQRTSNILHSREFWYLYKPKNIRALTTVLLTATIACQRRRAREAGMKVGRCQFCGEHLNKNTERSQTRY